MNTEKSESLKVTINQLSLIDGDLKLVLAEIKGVTPPDETLMAYCFDMVNTVSNLKMGGINIKAGYTKNIETFIGAVYVGTETIPDDDENANYYPVGSRSKRRYKWEILK